MSFVNGPRAYGVGTGGVEAFRMVKLSGVSVILNSVDGNPIGSVSTAVPEGELVSVRSIGADGTVELETGGAVPAGADVFAADGGKVQVLPTTAGTYRRIGIALKAAAAEGEIIEILPYDYHATETVS